MTRNSNPSTVHNELGCFGNIYYTVHVAMSVHTLERFKVNRLFRARIWKLKFRTSFRLIITSTQPTDRPPDEWATAVTSFSGVVVVMRKVSPLKPRRPRRRRSRQSSSSHTSDTSECDHSGYRALVGMWSIYQSMPRCLEPRMPRQFLRHEKNHQMAK